MLKYVIGYLDYVRFLCFGNIFNFKEVFVVIKIFCFLVFGMLFDFNMLFIIFVIFVEVKIVFRIVINFMVIGEIYIIIWINLVDVVIIVIFL